MAASSPGAPNVNATGMDPEAEWSPLEQPSGAPGVAWSQTPRKSDWDSPHRLVVFGGIGLAALAALAVIAGTVRTFSHPKSAARCTTAADCNALGIEHQLGAASSAPDPIVSAHFFQRACAWGSAEGCNNLGVAHQTGNGVEQDYYKARGAFERACNGGSAEGCNQLGALYEHGQGVAQNFGDARRWYSAACTQGAALGCSNLGVLYVTGRGVVANRDEALRLFDRACNSGSYVGCQNLLNATPAP